MRDVALWAFTVPFFEEREEELKEFEAELATLSMPTEAYLSQLSAIRTHDATGRLGGVSVPALVLAGEDDILIPVSLSKRLHEAVPGSEWATTEGGHACLWEHPEAFNRAILCFLERQRA
jgi:3-oxoadipate enol-lactonase